MKKLLKVVALILILLIGVVVAVPFLFKDRLVQMVKDNVNASVNATVDFGEFDLSIFRAFPDFSFTVEDISVDGKAPFDSTRLAYIDNASFTLDIKSVLKGDKVKIHGISIDGLAIDALVLEDGTANYDILVESADTTIAETTDVREEYVILLEKYDFTNASIRYDNRSIGVLLDIVGLDHTGDGELTDKRYDLNTMTTAQSVDVVYEGIRYLQKAEAEIEANFDIQDDFREYNLKENNIRLNELYLQAEGVVNMPEDGVDMDIAYKATRTDLKNILSLVPEIYLPDLAGVKSAGVVDLHGDVKGRYDDNDLPAFSIIASIADGRLEYPDLPEAIEGINLSAAVAFPGGADFNTTTIDLPTIVMNIADSPINGRFSLRTPLTDPYIDTDIKAQLDFENIKMALPMEGVQELTGIITADVTLKGNLSTIEQERYEAFDARGSVIMQNFNYSSDSLPVPVRIKQAHLNVDPRYMELANLNAVFGKTDLKGTGRIDNYLSYFLKDEQLKGSFSTTSDRVDLDEWMTEEPVAASGAQATDPTATAESEGVLAVPANVDIDLRSTIGELIYDGLTMKNVSGAVDIEDESASLRDVSMEMLGGRVGLAGSYSTKDLQRPTFDLDFKVSDFDIPTTFSSFNTVQTLAPIAAQAKGDFSTGFNLSTALDAQMNPIYSTMDGGGTLNTARLILENVAPLMKVADALQLDNWKSQSLKDVRLAFAFEDGKVAVRPFDVVIDGMKANISGTMDFDQNIDYDVQMTIPMSKLGGEANKLLGDLLGKVSGLGLNLDMGESVTMLFKLTGPYSDPKIRPSLIGTEGGSVKDAIIDKVTNAVDSIKTQKVEEVKDMGREQADKLIAEANKRGDQLVKEAERAADRLRAEGESAAKKIEDEAKNPLAKIAAKAAADKVRKEADKKALRLIDEARKKRTDLIQKAQVEADALLK